MPPTRSAAASKPTARATDDDVSGSAPLTRATATPRPERARAEARGGGGGVDRLRGAQQHEDGEERERDARGDARRAARWRRRRRVAERLVGGGGDDEEEDGPPLLQRTELGWHVGEGAEGDDQREEAERKDRDGRR